MNTNTDNVIDNAIVEVKPGNELVTIDPAKYAAAAFEPYKKDLATAKRAASKAGQFDITTTAGMKQAKELRASFRAVRTGIENARKEAKAPVIEAGKKIDEVAKEMTADVVPHETKYDEMIRLEEKRKEDEKQAAIAAERARIEAIENRLANICGTIDRMRNEPSVSIAALIESLLQQRLEPADYEEFLEQALTAHNATIDGLRELYGQAVAREDAERKAAADRAELARLRKQQEEADAKAKADAEELARLRAMFAAQQSAPAPAASPVATEESTQLIDQPLDAASPVISDTAPIESAAGEVIGKVVIVDAPRKTIPAAKRPSDFDIVKVVAEHFEVPAAEVLRWMLSFDIGAVREQLEAM